MQAEMQTEGKYIYCITRRAEKPVGDGPAEGAHVTESQTFGPIGIGGRSDYVTKVSYRDLSCVISDSPVTTYPVTRENTMAHQKVIEQVMQVSPVLPVRFGTIACSEQIIVEKVLAPRYDELWNLLNWVADKREIGVKVFWRELQPVFQTLVASSGPLHVQVAGLARVKPEKSYYDRIEVGKTLEELLGKKREALAETIIAPLKKLTSETKCNATYGDGMVLNGAFFVPVTEAGAFREALEKLDQELGENVRIKLITGAPPFNFVTITIKWEETDGISTG